MFASLRSACGGHTPDLPAALSNPPATELSSRDSDPTGQSRPGWQARSPQPAPSCVPPPPPTVLLPLTRAARVPAARGSPLPHPTNTAAPLACAMRSERRPRAARARSAAEGGHERGGRDVRGGGGRAPLPLAPGLEGREANQRVQEEPSPPRDSSIGLALTALLAGSGPAAKSTNSGRRPPLTGGGKGGTQDLSGKRVPTECPRLSVCSGFSSLPVSYPPA